MLPVLFIACIEETIWIRVIGRGNFQCSSCLKELVQEQFEKGHYNYIIDLAECEQLDSTFMGTLTGISQRFRTQKKGVIRVVNVSDNNRELMKNLGLDQLFPIDPIAEGKRLPPAALEHSFSKVAQSDKFSKDSLEDAVRSAHQALVTAHRDNLPKFQSLLEIIR
jgi:anti-anti-sigma factor